MVNLLPAISALSLHAEGQTVVLKADPIFKVIRILLEPAYQSPADKSSSSLGTSLDEISRHHASTKTYVNDCVIKLIEQLLILGEKTGTKEAEDFLINAIENVGKVLIFL